MSRFGIKSCMKPDVNVQESTEIDRKSSKRWSKKFRRKSRVSQSESLDQQQLSQQQQYRECSYIELIRDNNQHIGIIFSGGIDQAAPIVIQEINPESIAAKSEAIQVGDVIKAINSIQTAGLTHHEVTDILVNAGQVLSLQLEFSSTQHSSCVFEKSKKTVLTFPRDKVDFGFSIDGLEHIPVSKKGEYGIRLAHIFPNSRPYNLGMLKPGDKLLTINGASLLGASLSTAQALLSQAHEKDVATFEIEYPIAVHDNLSSVKGPYTLELHRPPSSSLGLSLVGSPTLGGPIVISGVKVASIADRSGAINVGDQILSINGFSVKELSVLDASKILQQPSIRVSVEILPEFLVHFSTHNTPIAKSSTIDSSSLMNSSNADLYNRSGANSALSMRSVTSIQHMPVRQESLILQIQPGNHNYGFNVESVSERHAGPVIISAIEPNSPAYKCGILMEGDRLLTINDHPVHSRIQAQHFLEESFSQNRILDLLIEFDVHEGVTPSSGTFDIKLVRSGLSSLGLTLNGPNVSDRGAVWIAHIRKGGIAYRCGSLQVGDVILAINNNNLANCSLSDAVELLQYPDEIITLKVSKESQLLGLKLSAANSIIYTVELPKDKGNLGISIRGTNIPNSPTIISHIMEGGVAARTGAVHVGDEILSINGISLKDKQLIDAARMMEDAEIVVAIQIRRADNRSQIRENFEGTKEYHVQYSVINPLKSPLGFNPAAIHSSHVSSDGKFTNHNYKLQATNYPCPPVNCQTHYSNYSYHGSLQRNRNLKAGIDHSKLAHEAAMRSRDRSLNRLPLQEQEKHYAPLVKHPKSIPNSDVPSTSLTNITQTEPNSSADSGSFAYNSSPTASHKQYARALSTNSSAVSNRHPSELDSDHPQQLHHSQDFLTDNIELKSLNKNKNTAYSQTLDRTGRITLSKDTIFSTPQETKGKQELVVQPLKQAPEMNISSSHKPVLENRNQNQSTKNRSVSIASWLELPDDNNPRPSRTRATSSSANTSSSELDNSSNDKYCKQNMSPISQASTKTLTMSNGTIKLNSTSHNGTESDLKQNNQELKKIIIQRSQLNGYGFSITERAKLAGIYVKSVEPDGAAHRGGIKPQDRILTVNGTSVQSLNCDKTYKILRNSKETLDLMIIRDSANHLSGQNTEC